MSSRNQRSGDRMHSKFEKKKYQLSDEDYELSEESAKLTRKNARTSLQKVAKTRADEEEMFAQTSRRRAEISKGKRRVMISDDESDEEDEPAMRVPAMKPLRQRSSSFEENYAILMRNDFIGTRYPCVETMDLLGIRQDVEEMFRRSNLTTFLMSLQRVSYREETCQFLASLELHLYADFEEELGLGYITFTVNDKECALSINEIDELYGFPRGTAECSSYDGDDLFAFWNTIGSKRTEVSSRAKSNEIRNPVIRYFHKSIASTFYARRASGTVNGGEMQLLCRALKKLLRTTACGRLIRGDRADSSLSTILVSHLMGYRAWAARNLNKNTTGVLSVGGLVTPILMACKVPIATRPYDQRLLDISHLKQSSSLAGGQVGNSYIWQFEHANHGESKVLLPCYHLTNIKKHRNIVFLPSRDHLYFSPKEDNEQCYGADLQEEGTGPQDMDCTDDYSTERFHFEESFTREGKSLKTAHKHIGLVQRWNKIQDKAIRKLKGSVKDLADAVKSLSLHTNERTSSSLDRRGQDIIRGSYSGQVQHPLEPARASSFEPSQRKRRATQSSPQGGRRSTSHFDSRRATPVSAIPDIEMAGNTDLDDDLTDY